MSDFFQTLKRNEYQGVSIVTFLLGMILFGGIVHGIGILQGVSIVLFQLSFAMPVLWLYLTVREIRRHGMSFNIGVTTVLIVFAYGASIYHFFMMMF